MATIGKPSGMLQTGLVLAMGGALLIFVSLLAGPGISGLFAYAGGGVILAGAAILCLGGVAYARRMRSIEIKREQIREDMALKAKQDAPPDKPAT